MENSKLFRNLWRINGIILLILGMMGLFVGGYAVREVGQHVFRDRLTTDLAPVEDLQPNRARATKIRVGGLEPVIGQKTLRAEVYSRSEHELLIKSKTSTSVRNYLFLESGTLRAEYLFPSHGQLIIQADDFPSGYQKKTTLAMAYFVVSNDTNGDGNLSRGDAWDLYVSDPQGKKLTKLMEGGSEILGTAELTASRWAVLYRKGSKYALAEIDMVQRRVLGKRTLPVL